MHSVCRNERKVSQRRRYPWLDDLFA
eukprot:COSAG02_NODE_44928_length_361_cov_1.786260_2_plen_25_part_01